MGFIVSERIRKALRALFKRKPVRTWELAATFDPAPCWQQSEHSRWERIEGMPCPMCKRSQDEAQKERDMQRLAELIAERVDA